MNKTKMQKIIGCRIKVARDAKNLTQEQLAKYLGFNDRQSISDIENGKRAIKSDELVRFSEILEQDTQFFLDPFCIIGEAQFSWRASPEIGEKQLNEFENNIGKLIGLVRWLRINVQHKNNPLEQYKLRLTKQSSYEDAIERAEDLVEKMNLGEIPSTFLIQQIENFLEIPILFVETLKTPEGQTISGAACHLDDFSIILINQNETESRRFFDIAHELFHVLTWKIMKPEHRESNIIDNQKEGKRIEQLADNFAAALLMPKKSLESLLDPNKLNNIDYLIKKATEFKVSPSALAWRLFNLKKIDEKMRCSLTQTQQPNSLPTKLFSKTFIKLLYQAIEEGKLSARKAAKIMNMDLSNLKELFLDYSLQPSLKF